MIGHINFELQYKQDKEASYSSNVSPTLLM